jgi:hypothetical protein
MLQVAPVARDRYMPNVPPDVGRVVNELGRRCRTPKELTNALIKQLEEDHDTRVACARFVVLSVAHTMAEAQAERNRRRNVQPTREQREHRRVEAKKIAKAVTAKIAERIVLDTPMPNGKRLRFCTGQEVGAFGAAFALIAAKVGHDCLVGEKLTEREARELLAASESNIRR